MDYPIEIIKEKIDKRYIEKFLNNPFKEMVKFVIDIEKEIIAVGGELHSDAAEILIKNGSRGDNLWGGNFYPLKEKKEDRIEYSSLINVSPLRQNFSMEIESKETMEKINKIIEKLIYE
ncbi:MAG: DUF5674 family protein [Candidatus Paceibacterota bacterium]